MPHIILLRAPTTAATDTTNDGRDPYEAALEPSKASSVPIYETVQVLDRLTSILAAGPLLRGYKGVVLTSKRSVDAWAGALDALKPPSESRASWSSIPFYVVGEATGRAVRQLSLRHESSADAGEILGAEETGTGEQLAHFILNRLAAERSGAGPWPKTRLLFLVGDKTKDSLQAVLGTDSNVELDSVQVYETKPYPHLSEALRDLMLQNKDEHDWWIAAFAPSGIDYALPHLEEHFEIPRSSDTSVKTAFGAEAKLRARLAAIGPTTAAHMREKIGLEVAAVATKPKPEELARAIRETCGK